MSSTNFRSILIFASCVVGTCNILDYTGEFFFIGGALISCFEKKNIYIYIWLVLVFYKNIFEDVSRECDEFRVNTRLCKGALLVFLIYYVSKFLNGRDIIMFF